ncbi:hypothetical protein QTP86_022236, partial [Hemibagrus guttatus]
MSQPPSPSALEGCVLSPLLYSMYTYDCVATTPPPSSTSDNTVVKIAQQHLYHLRRLRDFRLPL